LIRFTTLWTSGRKIRLAFRNVNIQYVFLRFGSPTGIADGRRKDI
jgi:hypothetical protein